MSDPNASNAKTADEPASTESSGEPIAAPALTDRVEVGPDVDAEQWRLTVPARPACYLLADERNTPLLLATVRDLRSALMRRLGPNPDDQPTGGKVDYRAVVRRVSWRPVYSRFEADWTYLENVRRLFPGRYDELIKRWRAHWIGIDPNETHPRFTHQARPFGPPSTCFGPLPTAKLARRYIEMLQDVFDLCRYHHILVQAPHGQACDYKVMGRCPAPCDGSVSMDHYRAQLRDAIRFICDPAPWLDHLRQQMKQASAELNFERASRLKTQLERAEVARSPEAARIAPLSRFTWLSLQPGQRKGRVRVFTIGGGRIEWLTEIPPKQREQAAEQLASQARWLAEHTFTEPVETHEAIERIGLASWHLLNAESSDGLLLRADEVREPGDVQQAMEQVVERAARSTNRRQSAELSSERTSPESSSAESKAAGGESNGTDGTAN